MRLKSFKWLTALEALSRGADKVFFVDEQKDCLKAIEATLRLLGFERVKKTNIIKGSVTDLNNSIRKSIITYSEDRELRLIFVDYTYSLVKESGVLLQVLPCFWCRVCYPNIGQNRPWAWRFSNNWPPSWA